MQAAQNKGFTLVELLVVITIIAILSTIGLVMYSSAQKSARIAKRIQDLKAIQTALEVYYSANKAYPANGAGGSWNSECLMGGSLNSDSVIPGLVPRYMPVFPADPQMVAALNYSCYAYSSNGTDYKLMDYNIVDFWGGVANGHTAEYYTQRSLVDSRREDGSGDCSKVDGTQAWAWAVYSTNTGVNNTTTNPACW